MRIRITFDVPDQIREYLASKLIVEGEKVQRTDKRRLTRAALIAYLQKHISDLQADLYVAHTRPLSEVESREAGEAINYLRGLGKTDAEIRAWLLMQRARLHFAPRGADVP